MGSVPISEFPRFSDAEYTRRHEALAGLLAAKGLDSLLAVTDQRSGNAPQWVTGWPGTVEAYVVFQPGERMTMHVEWHNHVPLARRIAKGVDVRWGEHRGLAKTVEELKRRGARRVGLIGPLHHTKVRALEESFEVTALDREYVRLRLIKSAEEIEWLRIGAALSDAGFAGLLANTRPGMAEPELADLVERAYIAKGGTTFIHYIGVTSMADPQLCVPPQFASSRKVRAGDVVLCELSASRWDYAGQVLRTFTVEAEPTPLYRALHETAEAAFDSVVAKIRAGTTMEEILDAAGLIEARGFTVCDDLMHGFGGGYFPPILGTRSRPAGPLPQMALEENMTVVVQPNVVTPDRKAGVQVGELVRVTRGGYERLHSAPRGFFRSGQIIAEPPSTTRV
jgi:Xaa-Pro aminopeptidase